MLPSKYLQGVRATPFEMFPGVFVTPHHKDPKSSRFICSYADGQRYKAQLFAFFARAGQSEARKQWDLHHIVEGQHFADVNVAGGLPAIYKNELPVVLIEKNEHVAYNMLLHTAATNEMFRRGTPRARVDKLIQLYELAYQGDSVLTRIALNVLNDARSLLA